MFPLLSVNVISLIFLTCSNIGSLTSIVLFCYKYIGMMKRGLFYLIKTWGEFPKRFKLLLLIEIVVAIVIAVGMVLVLIY